MKIIPAASDGNLPEGGLVAMSLIHHYPSPLILSQVAALLHYDLKGNRPYHPVTPLPTPRWKTAGVKLKRLQHHHAPTADRASLTQRKPLPNGGEGQTPNHHLTSLQAPDNPPQEVTKSLQCQVRSRQWLCLAHLLNQCCNYHQIL